MSLKPKCRVNRHNLMCPVFGTPSEHSGTNLPTYYDVMKHYLFVKQNLKILQNYKEPSFKDISDEVVYYLQNLWKKASIPSVSNKRIKDMLKTYNSKYLKIKGKGKSNISFTKL